MDTWVNAKFKVPSSSTCLPLSPGSSVLVPALPSAYSTCPRTALLRLGDKNGFQWGPKCQDKFELWLKPNGEAWEA